MNFGLQLFFSYFFSPFFALLFFPLILPRSELHLILSVFLLLTNFEVFFFRFFGPTWL
jgi:hypothetical protein